MDKHFVTMQVEKTKNYDKFVANKYQPHHRNGGMIIKSMEDHNTYLPDVARAYKEDGKFVLIDGHSRLDACRRTDKEFYYIEIHRPDNEFAISIANSVSNNWKVEDLVRAYAKSGIKEYIDYVYLMDNYGFRSTTVLFMLTGSMSISSTRNGVLRHMNGIKFKEVAELLADVRDSAKHIRYYGSVWFQRAVMRVIYSGSYDFVKLRNGIINNNEMLPAKSIGEYQYDDLIKSVYAKEVNETA